MINQNSKYSTNVESTEQIGNEASLEKLESISKKWITVSECSELFGMAKTTIKRRCVGTKKIKYVIRTATGVGGNRYEIDIDSVIDNLKGSEKKAWQKRIEENSEKLKTEKEIETDLVHLIYAKAPEYNRNIFDKNYRIYQACEGIKDKDLQKFTNDWNRTTELKTSVSSIRRLRKQIKTEGLISLLGKYGKNKGKTTVKDSLFEFYKSLRLTQGQLSAKNVHTKTLAYAADNDKDFDISIFPSVNAFERRLKNEVSEPARHLATKGYKSYNKKYNNYVDRNYDNLLSGEVWVSDHRQLDVSVIDDSDFIDDKTKIDIKKAKIKFVWLTAWIDFKSGKWLSWEVYFDEPNTDKILNTFVSAAKTYGIPKRIYIDNGKDYRAKDFAGGRKTNKINPHKVTSLCGTLGIEVTFSLPYNAQAKVIERSFKTLKEQFDKTHPTYRGGNVVERPERLNDEIRKGNIPFLSTLNTRLDFYIQHIMNKQVGEGKVLKGLHSRNDVWNLDMKKIEDEKLQSPIRKVSDEDLMLFMMRTSRPKKIGRNGVVLSRKDNLYYWHDDMNALKGRSVYLRRNSKSYQKAFVFDARDDSLICEAKLDAWKGSAQVENNLERKQLEKLLKKKRELEKLDKQAGLPSIEISVEEELRLHAKGIRLLNGDETEIENIPSPRTSQQYVISKISHASREIKKQKTGTYDFEFIDYDLDKPQEIKDPYSGE